MKQTASTWLTALLVGAAGFTLLTGCATRAVPMDAAVHANDPACADVIVRLPAEVATMERRSTNAQSTGAWGDPAAVLLQCGIEATGPTTLECINVNGIDWIIDRENHPMVRLEPYGREPGLQVIVDAELVSGTSVVEDLNAAISYLPQVRQCTSLADTWNLDGSSE